MPAMPEDEMKASVSKKDTSTSESKLTHAVHRTPFGALLVGFALLIIGLVFLYSVLNALVTTEGRPISSVAAGGGFGVFLILAFASLRLTLSTIVREQTAIPPVDRGLLEPL